MACTSLPWLFFTVDQLALLTEQKVCLGSETEPQGYLTTNACTAGASYSSVPSAPHPTSYILMGMLYMHFPKFRSGHIGLLSHAWHHTQRTSTHGHACTPCCSLLCSQSALCTCVPRFSSAHGHGSSREEENHCRGDLGHGLVSWPATEIDVLLGGWRCNAGLCNIMPCTCAAAPCSPWCYVGKRRLEKAIAQYQDRLDIEVQWLPYMLNPGAPVEGADKMEMYNQKFGAARVAQMVPHMTQ